MEKDALSHGPRFYIKTVFPRYGDYHVIFNMGISILVRRHLYIKAAPERFADDIYKMLKDIPGEIGHY